MDESDAEIETTVLRNSGEPFKWKRRQELVGVPRPELLESPASWITRFALTQGVEVAELADFLHLSVDGDFDLGFIEVRRKQLGVRCGLNPDEFVLMQTMFGRLEKLDKSGQTYLLSQGGYPQYRYCPSCLSEQTINCFPIHWRFKAWRLCPTHGVLLYDRCPHCDAVVVLPNDQIKGGSRRKGVAQISDCFTCGRSLYLNRPQSRFEMSRNQLTPGERVLCNNGRALLAALFTGYLWLNKEKVSRNLRNLNVLSRAGCFPHDVLHYEKNAALHIKYRHPRTHELVHVNKEMADLPSKNPWMNGLFDG